MVLILVVLSMFASSPSPGQGKSDDILARAGNVFIGKQEFVERYEMLPGLYRHRKPQLAESKLELLYSMIAEKLLSQEAEARALDRDSMYTMAMDGVRKALGRDELYREEITRKVHVSESEISRGVARAQRQILVAYLYSQRRSDADFLRTQMRNGEDFDRLEVDSSANIARDTATVIWGDAEPAVEDAAYGLRRSEVSPVILAGDGYYILKVEGVQRNDYFCSLQPDVLHDRVESIIRSRKEKARLNEFLEKVLKNKTGYAVPRTFLILGKAIEEVYRERKTQAKISMDQTMYEEIRDKCASSLFDTLAIAGTITWTVNDILARLHESAFEIDSGDIRYLPGRLNTQLKVWVQQEVLAQEALRRSLDKNPELQRQLEMWSHYYLAGLMKDYVGQHVAISDSEAWSYLQSKEKNAIIPQVRIRELRTTTADEMKDALYNLQNGMSFEHAVEKYSNDPKAKLSKGVSDFFPVTEHPPIGEIASQMDIGQRYGPITVEGGIDFFELLDRKIPATVDTLPVEQNKQAAEKELLAMKRKRTLTLFLAQVAKARGFEIDWDNLQATEVTAIPMMTFRILGFGGKMWAVPFVDKQLDWINVEPPSTPIIP